LSSWCLGKERTRRGERPWRRFNRRIRGTHRFVEQSPEVDGRTDGSRLAGECVRPNGMGAVDGDEPSPAANRENPLDGSRNPGRGCGMKQARKAGGGESRRGAEKARGRNEVGCGNPACPCPDTESWTPPVMSRRGTKPWQERPPVSIRYASVASDGARPGAPEKELRRGRRARENEPDSKGSGDGRSDKSPRRAESGSPRSTLWQTNAPRDGRHTMLCSLMNLMGGTHGTREGHRASTAPARVVALLRLP